jgi:hypothetical protein
LEERSEVFPGENNPERMSKQALIHDLEPEFLDHGVGEDFPRHAFHLFFSVLAPQTIQFQHKKLTLSDVSDIAKAKRRQGVLDRLPLGVQNCTFWHYPNMCFHRNDYIKPRAAMPV